MNNSNLAQTKTTLADMAAQARELQSAAGGSVTETVAAWLAARYTSAAHEKLAGADAARQWEILRAFVQDWNLLRRGDHMAERLSLDREKLAEAKKPDQLKALEICLEESKRFPEVKELFKAAFAEFKKQKSNK